MCMRLNDAESFNSTTAVSAITGARSGSSTSQRERRAHAERQALRRQRCGAPALAHRRHHAYGQQNEDRSQHVEGEAREAKCGARLGVARRGVGRVYNATSIDPAAGMRGEKLVFAHCDRSEGRSTHTQVGLCAARVCVTISVRIPQCKRDYVVAFDQIARC